MSIRRNDLLYLSLAIVLSILGAWVIMNPVLGLGLYIFAGLLILILAVSIILRPTLGANILIIAVMTNISDAMTKQGYPGLLKPLVGLVAIAILLHYAYTSENLAGRSKTSWIEFFLFFYYIIYTASYLVSTDRDRAAIAIMDFGKDIIIIYCIQFAIRKTAAWKQSAWILIAVTGFLCSLSFYQFITGNYHQNFFLLATALNDQVFSGSTTPRVGGPINAPNMWGQVLVGIMPLVLYRIINERRLVIKVLSVAIAGLIALSIFNTYSRGAYVALAVVTLLIALDLRVKPVWAFAMVAGAVLFLFILPSAYIERFKTLAELSPTSQNGIYQDTSFRGRSSEMLTGLEMFIKHPILGVGAANYKLLYQRYAQLIGIETRAEERDAHSLYIQIIAETGILGLVAFVALMASLFTALNRAISRIKNDPSYNHWTPWLKGLRYGLIGYLITSTFLHDAYIRYLWILVAMTITAIQLTYEMVSEESPVRLKAE